MLKFTTSSTQNVKNILFSKIPKERIGIEQSCGVKHLIYKNIVGKITEWPEKKGLKVVQRTPNFQGQKPCKMPKMIQLMRGPELVHNTLLYKGYGIKALLGGRLMYEHFETIRRKMLKPTKNENILVLWRVDPPWQPLSKRKPGQRHGGGKGDIHHYCTPVKADRIILELAGRIHDDQAIEMLNSFVELLPFPARVVSKKSLDAERKAEQWEEENNKNPFTMEYIIKNNMGGCHKWLSKYDFQWFGKYK